MLFRNVVLGALVLLSVPALTAAQDSKLRLPSFRHLQSKAVDTVDISIGRWPLRLAAAMVSDGSKDGEAAKEILRGIRAVYVRSYTFERDNSYSLNDIDEVRQQLKSPRWMPIAQIHSSKENSDVDIFVSMDGETPDGLAIVATEPREFTIVNVVGRVNPQDFSRIEKHLGLKHHAVGAESSDEN